METDYLIIGAGASGMAFADEVISQSKTARIILVDRRATAGGHWNNAYRFVTLHQPAQYYGVNSERLESSPDDLASGTLIVAYYARVLEKLRATGRVQFFGECDYRGEGRFVSLGDDATGYRVTVHSRTVDATDYNVTVPSTHPPEYSVSEGVHLVPLNALAGLDQDWSRYVVIGSGKTGMDAVLQLLEMGTNPDQITWVISNDAWLFNREFMKPNVFGWCLPLQLRETCLSKDSADYFRRFEAKGWLMRLDPSLPTPKLRCATVNDEELEALRTVKDVLRVGRVCAINPTEIVLEHGTAPTGPDVLHIDCTAKGLSKRPARPVFDGKLILLQPVAFCQPAMSAAMIANIEMLTISDDAKNTMSNPCPHPEVPFDYFVAIRGMGKNMEAWFPRQVPWLLRKRLSGFTHISFLRKIWMMIGLLIWDKGANRKAEEFIDELAGH